MNLTMNLYLWRMAHGVWYHCTFEQVRRSQLCSDSKRNTNGGSVLVVHLTLVPLPPNTYFFVFVTYKVYPNNVFKDGSKLPQPIYAEAVRCNHDVIAAFMTSSLHS